MLVISDIHGYKDGLQTLLEAAAYDPAADKLILLGDYVDADQPASWDTLDIVRSLVAGGAYAVPGNQELKLASLLRRRGSAFRKYSRFILSLPLYLKTSQYLFVHAGIRPGRPLQAQTVRDLTEIREPFYLTPPEQISVRRRIVFGHTPTFKLGAPAGKLWMDAKRIGIDTGAKHNCRLTLLDLSNSIAYSCETMPGYLSGSEVLTESIAELTGNAAAGGE